MTALTRRVQLVDGNGFLTAEGLRFLTVDVDAAVQAGAAGADDIAELQAARIAALEGRNRILRSQLAEMEAAAPPPSHAHELRDLRDRLAALETTWHSA